MRYCNCYAAAFYEHIPTSLAISPSMAICTFKNTFQSYNLQRAWNYRPPHTIILQRTNVYVYDMAVVYIIHLDCQRVKD